MDQALYENFTAAIKAKVPKKSELVQMLADLLRIERESVYRRLRGDVPFTLLESFTVANSLGLSLDEIANASTDKKPLYMELSMFKNDQGIHYSKLHDMADKLARISLEPDSEHGEACSTISPFLWPRYPTITRFYSFREVYQFSPPNNYIRFEDMETAPQLQELQSYFMETMRNFKTTYYIWDSNIINKLVRDIKYFESIRMITRPGVESIRDELRLFMRRLEDMAVNGKYEDTDNRFELYVSNVDIDMTYSYFQSQHACISTFLTFIVRSAATLNKETCTSIKDWVKSLKRVSTLISEAGEKERILFFEKQHQVLDTL